MAEKEPMDDPLEDEHVLSPGEVKEDLRHIWQNPQLEVFENLAYVDFEQLQNSIKAMSPKFQEKPSSFIEDQPNKSKKSKGKKGQSDKQPPKRISRDNPDEEQTDLAKILHLQSGDNGLADQIEEYMFMKYKKKPDYVS